MTENYNRIEDDRNISEASAEWDSPVEFNPNSNTYKLVRALLSINDRVDEDLEDIYEEQHIDSADGRDLDTLGALVSVDRNTNEGDDTYRARIKAVFRASTMGTTYDQFAEFCASVLSTDVDNLNFRTPYGAEPATVNVGADPSIYDALNLSTSDIRDLLGSGVPAGHEVNVLEGGTFRLKQDGQVDDPEKGLTSDGISTGGTLAADLV